MSLLRLSPPLVRRLLPVVFIFFIFGLWLSGCTGGVPITSWAGITPADDSLYVAFGPSVYALDLSNGNLRWKYPPTPVAGVQFYAPPGVTGDTVIVGSYGTPSAPKFVAGLDRITGAERWRYDRVGDHIVGGIVAQNGIAYVPAIDNRLYALDAISGTLSWTFDGGKLDGAQAGLWAAPLIVSDTLYLTSLDHRLYALADRSKVWEFKAGGALAGTPAYADGVLYVGGFDSNVYAVDARTGQSRWEASAGVDNWVWGTPAVATGTVYVDSLGGKVYAFDAASGKAKWPHPIEVGGPVRGGPVLAGDRLYVGAYDGKLYALDPADGHELWSKETAPSAHIYTTPVVVNDMVIIAVNDAPRDKPALVYAFDAKTGDVRWAFTPPAD